MDKKFFNGLAVGCISTLLVTLGVVTFMQNTNVVGSKDLTKLNRVTTTIKNEYYGEFTDEDILNGIFTGSCFNLDPYSSFLTLEQYHDVVDPNQQFVGIGINATYNKYTKVYKIAHVWEGSPAYMSGLKRNDIVEAIDGYDTYGLDLDMISDLIRGEVGTVVSLKVNRDGERLDIDIVRDHIDIPYAYARVLSEDIGYIKISSFTGTVAADFAEALESIAGVKGLVIDLRGNAGGTLACYKLVAEQILPSCTLQTLIRKNGKSEPLECESKLEEPEFKFVILCDSGTASCSESMIQAMVDLFGAKTVGEQTYGKGVAQEYFPIDDHSMLRLSIGYVESPNGIVWHDVGITPDVELEYEYLGEDFEESDLMCDNHVLAGYNLLADELGLENYVNVRPLESE